MKNKLISEISDLININNYIHFIRDNMNIKISKPELNNIDIISNDINKKIISLISSEEFKKSINI